ncbi:5'-nucleotidase SurE [Bacteroidia bacterium]|nr:5'-nucleotidase SurE [Bacteroidia bacterium]
MTENRKPLILITNDDGVQAKGINELMEGVRSLGEIVVIAPDGARSGMSSAISSLNPVRLHLLKKEEDLTIYSCSGTPVDCIKLGINEILERKPDLVLSGINHGSNSAICVIYSGTIGATLEGCILGIPSLGISLTDHSPDADFTQAVKYAKSVARKILENGLPKGTCLNLNVPDSPDVKGLKVCTQTMGYWEKEFQKVKDPTGRTVYWLTGQFANEDPDNEHNDEWALSHGYAALVPLQIDMTAHHLINDLNTVFCHCGLDPQSQEDR